MSNFKIDYQLSDDGVQSYSVEHTPSDSDLAAFKEYEQAEHFIAVLKASIDGLDKPLNLHSDSALLKIVNMAAKKARNYTDRVQFMRIGDE